MQPGSSMRQGISRTKPYAISSTTFWRRSTTGSHLFDASQLLGFLAAVMVLVLVPGPNTMIILAQGLSGRAAGLATVAGVELGTMVHTLTAALGLSALLAASPLAFNMVKFAGVAYLAIIGIRTILQEALQIAGRSNLPVPIAFRRALVTN